MPKKDISRIKGMDNVLRNLNKEIKGVRNRSTKGLIEASILIRRHTEEFSPKTPVDTGNLRASWFTEPFELSPFTPAIRLGYSASYAFFVHENVGANFRRPGSGAKWFEAALKGTSRAVLEVIKREAQIPE